MRQAFRQGASQQFNSLLYGRLQGTRQRRSFGSSGASLAARLSQGRLWDLLPGASSGRRLTRTRTRSEPLAAHERRIRKLGLTNKQVAAAAALAEPATGATTGLHPTREDTLLVGSPGTPAQAVSASSKRQPPHPLAQPAGPAVGRFVMHEAATSDEQGWIPAAAQREITQQASSPHVHFAPEPQ